MNKNIVIGVLALAVVGGIVIYGVNSSRSNVPLPTDTSTVSPTPSPVTPPAAVLTPGVPTATTDSAVSATASTVVVSGKVYPNGATTDYWFEYGTSADRLNPTPMQVLGSGYVNIPTPAYITGLTSNTTYYFRLVAQNSYGKVMGTQYTFKTNLTSPPAVSNPPSARTNSAASITNTTATLSGSVNPNGSPTSYWFEYGESANLGSLTPFQSASGAGTMSVSAALSGLRPQTKYHFRLNAQNQYGTVSGSIATFTTQGPAIPSKPTVGTSAATNITATGATLHGQINPNGAQTTYWFEYSKDPAVSTLLGTTTAISPISGNQSVASVSADISDLATKTRYYFRLVGQNSQGIVKGNIQNFKTN